MDLYRSRLRTTAPTFTCKKAKSNGVLTPYIRYDEYDGFTGFSNLSYKKKEINI